MGRDGPLEPDYVSAAARPSKRPARKFCAVRGHLAKYKEPGSGLHFSSYRTFEQIKNQPPPWVRLSGEAPYHEALRLIQRERLQHAHQQQQKGAPI